MSLRRLLHHGHLYSVGLLLAVLLAGCGAGSRQTTSFVSPPPPAAGAYAIATANYYDLYTTPPGGYPFDPGVQFTSANYPVPVSYATIAPGPAGFELTTQSENVIKLWAKADPRMTIVSGAPVNGERIKTELVDSISWDGRNNILGLTQQANDANGARFVVLVATIDPIDHTPLSALDLQKTLAHEFGHAFGLGHAPEKRNLMYYQANTQQGALPDRFVTYGDAMALWTTLNARAIHWVATRPTITAYQAPAAPLVTTTNRIARVDDRAGEVVCVYTKE